MTEILRLDAAIDETDFPYAAEMQLLIDAGWRPCWALLTATKEAQMGFFWIANVRALDCVHCLVDNPHPVTHPFWLYDTEIVEMFDVRRGYGTTAELPPGEYRFDPYDDSPLWPAFVTTSEIMRLGYREGDFTHICVVRLPYSPRVTSGSYKPKPYKSVVMFYSMSQHSIFAVVRTHLYVNVDFVKINTVSVTVFKYNCLDNTRPGVF